jgi:hypothetical protein
MTRIFLLGRHEVRIFSLDPVLVYVRFVGDLPAPQAQALVQLLSNELGGRNSRFLVDASELGAIGADSRRELMNRDAAGPSPVGMVADIALVGASLLHKVVLAQLVSAASAYHAIYGQTHFFDTLDDALRVLDVPAALLMTTFER